MESNREVLRKIGNRCPARAYTMHDSMGKQKLYSENHESERFLTIMNGMELHVCMYCGSLFALEKKNEG